MKRVLDYIITSKYFLFAYAALLLLLKLLTDNFKIPEAYQPWVAPVTTIFDIIFAIAGVHFILLLVIAFFTRNKSNQWWNDFEKESKGVLKENIIKYFFKAFLFTLPILIYFAITHIIISRSWNKLLIYEAIFLVFGLIDHFINKNRQSFRREV